MKKNEFELLNGLYDKKKIMTTQEKIAELRSLARKYRDDNNQLISKKWELDLQIAKENGTEDPDLLQKRQDIEQNITENDYQTKIESLLKTIHDLEVEEYGHSDIGSHSPYKL